MSKTYAPGVCPDATTMGRPPAGKALKPRAKDPLPCVAAGLFYPVGAFLPAHADIIATNERYYSNGSTTWKGAVSSEFASHKRAALVARLSHPNFRDIAGASELALVLGSCVPGDRCRSHACPECARAQQRCVVAASRAQFGSCDPGYSDWAITIIMPEGQTRFDSFDRIAFNTIMARVLDALTACKAVKFAVIGFDISANDDREKFERGRLTFGPQVYAQVHLHGVVRATSKEPVWKSLRELFGKAANIYRPLTVLPFDGSARGISYICKPDAYRHVVYRNASGDWATPRTSPALKPREHVFYSLQMHALGLLGRMGLVGLQPVGSAAHKRITFRRISRGRCPM